MDRHEKWEKVSAGYRFKKGEPLRVEEENGAKEVNAVLIDWVLPTMTDVSHFRDKTWFNAKVGDITTNVDDLKRLPEGSLLISQDDVIKRVYPGGIDIILTDSVYYYFWENYDETDTESTIIYLPKMATHE